MKYALPLIIFVLAACVETPQPASFKPYRYGPSIALNVASINVNEEPQDGADVSQRFPIPLNTAVRAWANERLRAVGKEKRIEVIIKEASAKEVPLPVKDGIKGALTDEPNKRIDARIEVEIRLYSTGNLSDASVNVVATRSQTLLEKTPIGERDRLMYTMVEAMMKDLDASLLRNMREQFGNIVVR